LILLNWAAPLFALRARSLESVGISECFAIGRGLDVFLKRPLVCVVLSRGFSDDLAPIDLEMDQMEHVEI
jgi:hypothetical protein